MEQPFVWPEIPADLSPWGKAERQKETDDAVAATAEHDKNQQRGAATSLRKQVEMLFKREDTITDEVIERKKREGIELSKSEQEKEEKRIDREAALRKMSSIQLWEEQRTGNVVETGHRSKYTIKA